MHHQRTNPSLLSLVLLLPLAALGPGCAAQRLVAPETPPLAVEPVDLTGVKVAVRAFDATNQSEADVHDQTRGKLQQAFLRYLANSASFGLVVGPQLEPPSDAVVLDVWVRVDQDASRTIIFDGLFFYPFCGTFPFTPEWGHATVDASIRFRDPTERPIEVQVVAPYSVVFYSWYRTGPIEDAFRRAHDAAFRQLTAELVSRLSARERRRTLARAPEPAAEPTWTLGDAATASTTLALAHPDDRSSNPTGPRLADPNRTDPNRTDPNRTDPSRADPSPPRRELLSAGDAFLPSATGTGVDRAKLGLSLGAREQVRLQPEGVGIIFEPFVRPREEPGFFGRWLGALGGLEGSLTGGVARVESRARSAAGFEELVGSGNARSHGYRLSLYQPPDRTGFFFPPVLGFLSQTIEIDGFQQDVPVADLAGAETIGARVSDPATGAPIDLSEPIAYGLKLQSGYIGQGIGLNMVIGTEDVQLFGTLRAAINLLEVRHMEVDVFQSHVSGMSLAAFQSGSVGAQLGLAIPVLHLAIRGAVQVEWYSQFDYPLLTDADGRQRPPEFQAAVRYDPTKNVYERERVFVEGAGLRTIDWLLSVVALF